jgi:hypothetical protein
LPSAAPSIPLGTPPEAIDKIFRESGATPVYATGPQTAGAEIVISGKRVKLPLDATLDGVIVELFGTCTPSPCPQTPIYTIKRGKSLVWASVDGTLDESLIAPGEDSLFDFLRNALR